METDLNGTRATLDAALDELEAQVGPTTLSALGVGQDGRVVIEAVFGSGHETGTAQTTWALECGAHAQSQRLGRWCPYCPASHHTNRLAPISNDHTRPPSTDPSSHAFLTDGSIVLGHLVTRGVVRSGLEREALIAVRRALSKWQARSPRDVERAHVLLSASGRRLSWSPSAMEWLGERWDQVASSLRDLIDDPQGPPLVIDGAVATWSTMSNGPRRAHLVCFSRPGALRIDWSHGLGERQLAVANMARAGYDNPHIATELGISRDTVKYHLKHAFKLLEVSTRAELATLLGPDAPGCI